MHANPTVCTAALLGLLALGDPALAQDWPEIFDPLVLRTLNLEMDEADWQTIQQDETFDIEVPTQLWLEGEDPILVSIRRKSADTLTASPGFDKVSYKIDINELVSGQNWHGLRKLSLENGDDQDVLSEGIAWYLHRLASGPEGYGYDAGLASWVRLVINGVDTGVYLNVEQRDKRFLENRGLWVEDETWLYEVEDLQGFELDEGGPEDSPTFDTLCYAPFASPSSCPTPDATTLAAALPGLVAMNGLLALAAVDAVTANPDAIFSKGKNFYFADYLSGTPRLHFPWDLDSALGGGAVNADVYATGSAYSAILLAVPEFRAQYSQILNDLVCGPFDEAGLIAFLDALEPVLGEALAADPNNQFDGEPVAAVFASRKAWLSDRLASVTAQIENFVPCEVTRWTDLGFALPGTNGPPSAVGTGPLTPGSANQVDLTGALSGASTTLVVSPIAIDAPFKGGTLVPKPDILVPFVTNGAGAVALPFVWPLGTPSGVDLYWQFWVSDPGGPKGLAASNGLRSTSGA